jgi:hypothetical protein
MDSGSDEAGDERRAKRLLDAVQGLLEGSLRDGLSATCDLHVSDRAGRLVARRRVSVSGDYPREIVVCEKPAASGQASATGEIEVGINGVIRTSNTEGEL